MHPAPAAEQQQLVQFSGAPGAAGARPRRVHPHPSRRPAPRAVAGALHARTRRARATWPRRARSTTSRSRARSCSTPASRARPGGSSRAWATPPSPSARRGAARSPTPLSTDEPEGISLFDRERRRQVCLYPRAGREAHYDEDEGRPVDVLEHDLSVRFDPQRGRLDGQDTLRLRLSAASLDAAPPPRRQPGGHLDRLGAGGRPRLLPRARPGQPDGLAGRAVGHDRRDLAHRPLPGRALADGGRAGAAGRAVPAPISAGWTATIIIDPVAHLLEPDRLVPAGGRRRLRARRGCASTCRRAGRRSRAARACRAGARAAGTASSTSRTSRASTSRSWWDASRRRDG